MLYSRYLQGAAAGVVSAFSATPAPAPAHDYWDPQIGAFNFARAEARVEDLALTCDDGVERRAGAVLARRKGARRKSCGRRSASRCAAVGSPVAPGTGRR
jgi:hypothetical protein